jgi:hypothetical protein
MGDSNRRSYMAIRRVLLYSLNAAKYTGLGGTIALRTMPYRKGLESASP